MIYLVLLRGLHTLVGESNMVSVLSTNIFCLSDFDSKGDLVHMRVFGQHIVIVNSVETATDLFEKRSKLYSDRPITPMIDL